jgi:hypothetical protein
MQVVRTPYITEVAAASDGAARQTPMNADVMNDEVCGAVCRHAHTDPREGAQRWHRRPQRNDRDRHDGKDQRKQVVRVDATPSRAVVRAVPHEPATVHQHSM